MFKRLSFLLFALAIAVYCVEGPDKLEAQIADPVTATEAPVAGAGHSYIGTGAETVNPADGSVTFDLPLQPPAGRGISMKFGLRFSGTEQFFLTNQMYPGGQQYLSFVPVWQNGQAPWQSGAWSYDLPIVTTQTSVFWMNNLVNNGCYGGTCTYSLNLCWGNDSYVFRGLDGPQYSLAVASVFPDPNNSNSSYCPSSPGNQKSPGNRHGILATLQNTSEEPPVQVIDQSGTVYQFPGVGAGEPSSPNYYAKMTGALASTITDRNGNQLKLASNGLGYVDSTGRTAVSWSSIGNSSGDTINVSGLGSPVTVKWTNTNVSFPETGYNVGSNSCQLYNPNPVTMSVVSEIDLPNGQKYSFAYDGTYGKIQKIMYPDGGYVRYVWGLNRSSKAVHAGWTVNTNNYTCDFIFDQPAITDRYVSYDGSTEVLHQQFTYATSWNGTSWTSKSTTVTATDMLTNQVTKTVYTYGPASGDQSMYVSQASYSNLIPVETEIDHDDGSGNRFQTEYKTWQNPHVMVGSQKVLDNGQGNAVVRCFDANEQVTNTYEYGFLADPNNSGGYSQPSCYPSSVVGTLNTSEIGSLRRQTATVWEPYFSWNGSTTPPQWSGSHIVNAPETITVADASGNTRKYTSYSYDGNALTSSGAINLVGAPEQARANPTTVQRLISGSQYATTTSYYYDTGQPYQIVDACGNTSCGDMSGSNHTTTYYYDDNYLSGTGTPPGQTHAYLTHVIDTLNHNSYFNWGFNDGLIRSQQDPNGLTTTYTYNDSLARVTQITYPDGSQTNVSYHDYNPSSGGYPSYIQTSGSHLNRTTNTLRDGLAHTTETQITSDPQGTIYTDTAYDGFARVWKTSNPYRNSDPTTSSGTTVYAYDAIGRKISETYPDNSVLTTAYCGQYTLVTDPTGHQRRSRTDGLGLMIEVDEPNTTGVSLSTCAPSSGDPVWVTNYTYDTMGNLATVVQNSSHSRSFTYDDLGHLQCSSNPENSSASCPSDGGTLPSSGAVLYSYDANGNVSTKTDSRGIRVTYGYDNGNRLTSRSYSDGTAPVSITYDQGNCLGLTGCQNIGYRTTMTDGAGTESWAYFVDRSNSQAIHREQRTTNNVTKSATYYLDLAGNIKQIVYPTGRTVNYTYDGANRPATATDASSGITYATGQSSPPTGCPSGEVCYTPQGSIYGMAIGQTSTFTGLNVTETFNNRLQPNEIKASSTAGNALDLTYNFADANGHNGGHVYSINNVLNSARSQTFSYDQLNRITSAGTSATSGSYCWGYQYSYDAWGNLLQQTGWSPNYNSCTQYNFAPFSSNNNFNHLDQLGYDAAGNTTTDEAGNSYTWDGESELKAAAGVTYTYDGDGRRAEKSSGKLYWYGSGGEILAETGSSGNITAEYVFFGGKRVAMLPASGSAQYYVEDFLGSSRIVTTNTGTVCYDADFTPFGAERAYTSNCPTQNAYKFEGKERDASETDNDDFGARYYRWRTARWLSSDWSAVPVAVPYANLTNPQTLNLYAMASDDPESFADLDGHQLPDYQACREDDPIMQSAANDFDAMVNRYESGNWYPPPAPAQQNAALVPLASDVNYTIEPHAPGHPEVHPVFSPETAERLDAAFRELNKDGIVPQIDSAFRTPSDQNFMQSGGSGSNPAAKTSWHEAGAAIDIGGTRTPQYKTIISVMKKNGFVWGGDFHSRKDPPHFDGRNFSGNLSQAVRKAQGYWDSIQ